MCVFVDVYLIPLDQTWFEVVFKDLVATSCVAWLNNKVGMKVNKMGNANS